jgi:hypothetical protein
MSSSNLTAEFNSQISTYKQNIQNFESNLIDNSSLDKLNPIPFDKLFNAKATSPTGMLEIMPNDIVFRFIKMILEGKSLVILGRTCKLFYDTIKKDPELLKRIDDANLFKLIKDTNCLHNLSNKELLTNFLIKKIIPLLGEETKEVLTQVGVEMQSGAKVSIDTSYHKSATWFALLPTSTSKSLMVQIALRLVNANKKYLSLDKPIFMLGVTTPDTPLNILKNESRKNISQTIRGSSRAGIIFNLEFENPEPTPSIPH